MKKILLFIALVLSLMLLLVGCGGYSSDEMLELLNKRYPNDEIEIISQETIKISSDINATRHEQGTKWHLKSNTTGFEFDAQDYRGSSTWASINELKDNYFDVYYLDFVKKYNDSRIKLETYIVDDPYGVQKVFDAKLYFADYNYSKSQIANAVFSFMNKIKSDNKLMELLPQYFWVDIYDGEKIIASIDLEEAKSTDSIINEINEQLEKYKDPWYSYTPTGVIVD